jgi:hypothetical protein
MPLDTMKKQMKRRNVFMVPGIVCSGTKNNEHLNREVEVEVKFSRKI